LKFPKNSYEHACLNSVSITDCCLFGAVDLPNHRLVRFFPRVDPLVDLALAAVRPISRRSLLEPAAAAAPDDRHLHQADAVAEQPPRRDLRHTPRRSRRRAPVPRPPARPAPGAGAARDEPQLDSSPAVHAATGAAAPAPAPSPCSWHGAKAIVAPDATNRRWSSVASSASAADRRRHSRRSRSRSRRRGATTCTVFDEPVPREAEAASGRRLQGAGGTGGSLHAGTRRSCSGASPGSAGDHSCRRSHSAGGQSA
jgi:hypothetical protein